MKQDYLVPRPGTCISTVCHLKKKKKCVKSDVRFLILGENFLLLEGRKSIFFSASRSQFVAIGPAKILKIGQRIMFYGQNEF